MLKYCTEKLVSLFTSLHLQREISSVFQQVEERLLHRIRTMLYQIQSVDTHFSLPPLFQTPGRGGSQSSDSDSSATPGNAVDVNNEGSSEVLCTVHGTGL